MKTYVVDVQDDDGTWRCICRTVNRRKAENARELVRQAKDPTVRRKPVRLTVEGAPAPVGAVTEN